MAYARREDRNAARRRLYAANVEQERAAAAARSRARWEAMTPEERTEAGRRRKVAEADAVERRRRSYEVKLRADVLAGYGGACACCGTDYEPHLTIDHVEGGGSAERTSGTSNRTLMRRLRRDGFPPGYQVLCWNCNWAKHRLGACGCSGARLEAVS